VVAVQDTFTKALCYNRYECYTKQVCDTTCGISCFQTCGHYCLHYVKECNDIFFDMRKQRATHTRIALGRHHLLPDLEEQKQVLMVPRLPLQSLFFSFTLWVLFFLYRHYKKQLRWWLKVKAFLGQSFINDHNDPNGNLDETVTDEEAVEANNGSIIQVEREGEMEDEQQKDEMVEATKPMTTEPQRASESNLGMFSSKSSSLDKTGVNNQYDGGSVDNGVAAENRKVEKDVTLNDPIDDPKGKGESNCNGPALPCSW